MKSNGNLAIGVLSVTATILLVGLVLVHSQTEPALAASGAGIQAGDYILATGQFKVDEELFYLLDSVSQQLVVYRWDAKGRLSFGPTQSIDLQKLRENAPADPKAPKPRSGYNRP